MNTAMHWLLEYPAKLAVKPRQHVEFPLRDLVVDLGHELGVDCEQPPAFPIEPIVPIIYTATIGRKIQEDVGHGARPDPNGFVVIMIAGNIEDPIPQCSPGRTFEKVILRTRTLALDHISEAYDSAVWSLVDM